MTDPELADEVRRTHELMAAVTEETADEVFRKTVEIQKRLEAKHGKVAVRVAIAEFSAEEARRD